MYYWNISTDCASVYVNLEFQEFDYFPSGSRALVTNSVMQYSPLKTKKNKNEFCIFIFLTSFFSLHSYSFNNLIPPLEKMYACIFPNSPNTNVSVNNKQINVLLSAHNLILLLQVESSCSRKLTLLYPITAKTESYIPTFQNQGEWFW